MGLSGGRAPRPVPQEEEEEEDCKPLKRCHLTFQHRGSSYARTSCFSLLPGLGYEQFQRLTWKQHGNRIL